MKKYLFFLLLFPVLVNAQESQSPNYFNVEQSEIQDPVYGEYTPTVKQFSYNEIFADAPVEKSQIESQFIRYCNYRYYKQRRTSFLLAGAGTVLSGSVLFIDDLDASKYLSIGGAVLNLSSIVFFLNAEKWLKYSSIKPADTGVGVKIIF